jgi:hypothetical protein
LIQAFVFAIRLFQFYQPYRLFRLSYLALNRLLKAVIAFPSLDEAAKSLWTLYGGLGTITPAPPFNLFVQLQQKDSSRMCCLN